MGPVEAYDVGLPRKRRQSIHTYPFKYRRISPEQFFKPDRAAIYIHVPFCTAKCHFCDFTVYTNKGAEVSARYVDVVTREIEQFVAARAFRPFRIEAVYIGGGTPGLLTGDQLVQLLEQVHASFDVVPGCEVAVEFDPPSISAEKLDQLYEAGFNRLSVGVQCFDDRVLAEANRTHEVADVFAAFDTIDKSRFTHTNLDLIYPLPGLTMDAWRQGVQQAIALRPSCISLYGLEIWPGTRYHHWLQTERLDLPDADTEVEMYLQGVDTLEAAGYVARSTNGYHQPDQATEYCRYLDYYWRTWPMLGFGVSSKSAVGQQLWTNVKGLDDYIRLVEAGQPPLDLACVMTKPQEMRRVAIRSLKTCAVDKEEFEARFGVAFGSVFPAELAWLVDNGLAVDAPGRVELTRQGRARATSAYHRFYTAEDLEAPREHEVQYGISALVAD